MNSPIGLTWQPGKQTINMDKANQPPSNITGGPSATKVLSLNLPNRPAPNSPVPLNLLQGQGSAGQAPGFATLLAMLTRAMGGQAFGQSQTAPTTVSQYLQQPGGLSGLSQGGGTLGTPTPRITLGNDQPSPLNLTGERATDGTRQEVLGAPAPLPIDNGLNATGTSAPSMPTFAPSAPSWFQDKYADTQNVTPLF